MIRFSAFATHLPWALLVFANETGVTHEDGRTKQPRRNYLPQQVTL